MGVIGREDHGGKPRGSSGQYEPRGFPPVGLIGARMGPRLLLLETSGRVGQVGLAADGRLLAGRRLSETHRHARDLAPTVAALFREFAWKPADVQAVVVSRGPGSYTGLRVGVMTAKAFAYATGCRLLALDTF